MLDGKPLSATASVRLWAQGNGGKVAQSLVNGLLLPEDIQFFSDGSKDSIVQWLQWHTIAVSSFTVLFIYLGV